MPVAIPEWAKDSDEIPDWAKNVDEHPPVKLPSGEVATVRSIGVGDDRGEWVIPTIVGGKPVSNEEAISLWKSGNNKPIGGPFQSIDEANSFAQSFHESEAKRVIRDYPGFTTTVTTTVPARRARLSPAMEQMVLAREVSPEAAQAEQPGEGVLNMLQEDVTKILPKPIRTALTYNPAIELVKEIGKTVGSPAVTGFGQGLETITEGLRSPVGLATMGMGDAPVAVQRAVSLAFATQMASDIPEIATQLGDEFGRPPWERDNQKIARLITQGAGAVGFTTIAAKHGISVPEPRIDLAPQTTEAVKQVTGKESNASSQPNAEGSTQREIRPRMGEETPLRQQGQAAEIQPSINAPGQESVPAQEPAAAGVLAEPAIKGMGGATPEEFTPNVQTPTSIKNAQVEQERIARGLPPAIETAKRGFGKVWDETMAKIDRDPGYQDRLIGELKDHPRAVNDMENAALLHRQIDLQNEYGKATRDLAQAFDDGRMDDVTSEKARVEALSDRLLELYDINKFVGTETARGLAARRMMAMEDFSLAKMEMELRASKGGRPLTDTERSEVVSANETITKTQKAFDEYVTSTEQKEMGDELQQALDEMQKDIPE